MQKIVQKYVPQANLGDPLLKRGITSEYLETIESLPGGHEVLSDPFHTMLLKKLEVLLLEARNTFTEEEEAKLGIPMLDLWTDPVFSETSGGEDRKDEGAPSKNLWIRAADAGYADVCEWCRMQEEYYKVDFKYAIYSGGIEDSVPFLKYTYRATSRNEKDLRNWLIFSVREIFFRGKLECLKHLESEQCDVKVTLEACNPNFFAACSGLYENRDFLNYILYREYISPHFLLVRPMISDELKDAKEIFIMILKIAQKKCTPEQIVSTLQPYISKVKNTDNLAVLDEYKVKVDMAKYIFCMYDYTSSFSGEYRSDIKSTHNDPEIVHYIFDRYSKQENAGDISERGSHISAVVDIAKANDIPLLEIAISHLPYEVKLLLYQEVDIDCSKEAMACIIRSIPGYVISEALVPLRELSLEEMSDTLALILYEEGKVDPQYIGMLEFSDDYCLSTFQLAYTYHRKAGAIPEKIRRFLIAENIRLGRKARVDILKKAV